MKALLIWITVIVLGVLLLAALPGVWMLGRSWMGGYGGMMGGYGWMHPFGWGGMLMMWFIPLGVIIAFVLLGAVLVRGLGNGGATSYPAAAPARLCAHCGKSGQADWTACPYCGEKY
ncbi:MAG: zinc ribbon domain-containing protein [Chloroflexi bacterium]|nr:zinc ribbon domain-containing protein [Chloroflexota bacterium]